MKGKTIIITGGSRGIGLAIAIRFAAQGANVVVLTKEKDLAVLPQVQEQLVKAGGQAMVLDVDICDCEKIQQAVLEAVKRFGGIDGVVNNTSATIFTATLHTSPQQFDALIATSVRAAFFVSQACLPYLKKSSNPHIINISPPLTLEGHWFKDHLPFSLSKCAMSLCTVGMAEEFRESGIAVNSLWPRSTIATPTIENHFSPKVYAGSRWPFIMGDAALELIRRPSRECTGQFFTDEDLLRQAGIEDFSHYAVDPSMPLFQALFIPAFRDSARITQDLFR
jgi:citronellol/citronellal dehydrogenase